MTPATGSKDFVIATGPADEWLQRLCAPATGAMLADYIERAIDLRRCEHGDSCSHDHVCRIHQLRLILQQPMLKAGL